MTHDDIDNRATSSAKRQRIAKLIARVGLCSRRDAEAWILAGRVSVNGELLTSPALDVGVDDMVLVDGAPLPTAEKTRLFMFHKPRGLVTSDRDPEGRATIFDYLRENWPEGPRVVTVGRLDINTEGLLLLTNDGGLARVLELPQTGWVRRYRVRAKGDVDPAALDALADGIAIDGVTYAGIEAKLDRVQGANCWLTMGLREGKNREVKRVLEHLGLEVNRLIRLSFGPFQLLDLPEGAVEEIRTRVLRDQLGPTLAAQADVSFDEADVPKGRDALPTKERRQAVSPRKSMERRPANRAPGRSRAEERDVAPPPKRDRPAGRTRKHVSTLRVAERAESRDGPRKRIERSDTQDRRARTVTVERLVSTRPEQAADRRPRQEGRRAEGAQRARPPQRGDAEKADTRGTRTARGRSENDRRPESGRRRESPSAEAKRQRRSRSGARSEHDQIYAGSGGAPERRPKSNKPGRHQKRRETSRGGRASIGRQTGPRGKPRSGPPRHKR